MPQPAMKPTARSRIYHQVFLAPAPSTEVLGVGAGRGRAEPELEVEAGGRGGDAGGAAGGGGGSPDVDVPELADAAVADEGAGEAEDAGGALLGAELEDAFVAVDVFAQGPVFGEVEAHGLFEVNVLAGADGGQGGEHVPVIGGGDEDGVEVLAGDQFAEVVVGGAVLVLVVLVDAVAGLLEVGRWKTSQSATTCASFWFRKLLMTPWPWGPRPMQPTAMRLPGATLPARPRAEAGASAGRAAAERARVVVCLRNWRRVDVCMRLKS